VDGAETPLRLRGEARRVSGRVAARRCLRLAAAVVVADVFSSASTSSSSLSHGDAGCWPSFLPHAASVWLLERVRKKTKQGID
jgi:hypothetical protein